MSSPKAVSIVSFIDRFAISLVTSIKTLEATETPFLAAWETSIRDGIRSKLPWGFSSLSN
jgi:hypothetical protein